MRALEPGNATEINAVVLFQASQRIHGPKMEHTTGDLDLEGVGASVTSTSRKRKKTAAMKETSSHFDWPMPWMGHSMKTG